MSDFTKPDLDINNIDPFDINASSPLEFFDQAEFSYVTQENNKNENYQISESEFSNDKTIDCSSPKTNCDNSEIDHVFSEIYENISEESNEIKTIPENCDNLNTINTTQLNSNEECNYDSTVRLENSISEAVETEMVVLSEEKMEKVNEENLSNGPINPGENKNEEILNDQSDNINLKMEVELNNSLNNDNVENENKNEEIIDNLINKPIKTESEDVEMETLNSVDIDSIRSTEIHVSFFSTNSTEIDKSPSNNDEESQNQSTVATGNTYKLRSSITKLESHQEQQSITESVSPIELKLEMETKPENIKSLKRRKSIENEIDSMTPKKLPKSDHLLTELEATPIVKRRISTRIEEKKRVKLEKSMLSIEKKEPKRTRVRVKKESISSNKKPSRKSIRSDSYPNQDPGKWPQLISQKLKTELIAKGPIQIENAIFPRDERNRCFSINSYLIKLPNGDKQRRNWIVYSQSCDAAFCFPCRIFAYESNSSFANVGYNNWKKLADRILSHEDSTIHQASLEKWVEHSLAVDGEQSGLKISDTEAKNLAKNLRQFASGKNNKLYLLAKQMELELNGICEKEKPKKK